MDVDYPEDSTAAPEYDLLVADPPWELGVSWDVESMWRPTTEAGSYPRMSPAELTSLPAARLAAKERALLVMWTTSRHFSQALRLIEAWGFDFRGILFTWVKTNADGSKLLHATPSRQYPLRCSEFVLLGVRGPAPINQATTRDVIIAPRREHSRKPEAFWEALNTWLGDTYPRRLELFAREPRPGYSAWGNQTAFFQ